MLGFIGIADPQFIVAEGLALGEDSRRASVEAALTQASRITADRLAA